MRELKSLVGLLMDSVQRLVQAWRRKASKDKLAE